jgi:hypothetical protein
MSSITLPSPQVKRGWLAFPKASAWSRGILYGIVSVIVVLGAFFAHELGHAIVAQIFGARIVMFNVLGMQWYPKLEWMPQLGFGGYVYWFAPVSQTNHRLIVMAGSTLTLFLSVIAVIGLNLFLVRGVVRFALAVVSLYFLDSLIKILPIVGLVPPGWNSRFTRSFSEAYFAAVGLGIPSQVYIGAIFGVSLFVTLFLVRVLWIRNIRRTPSK